MIDDFKSADKPKPPLQDALDSRNAKVVQPDNPVPKEEFKTPEEVAADQTLETPEADTAPAIVANGKIIKPGEKSKFALSWPLSKKQWLIILAVVLVIAAAIGGYLYSTQKSKPVVVKKVVVVAPKPVVPKTVASTLSGLQVDPSLNAGPVTGVMIENSQDARPQSGLSQASVVFEAIAEGGITRFLALFQDTAPDNVGPIRSARPYYLQWALGFDAGYAHVGGSPEALASIKTWGVRDLDQFYNSGSYHRVTSRIAPHNVYTSVSTLVDLEKSKGYTSSNYTGFPRKAEAPAKIPTAKTINISISGPIYNVTYTYDPATNSYLRSEGGEAHIDANTNTQIKPKVVVAMVMPYSLEADGYHSSYNTIGSGTAYIYQDGLVTNGQWSKSGNASQFTFTDSSGTVIKFNPGQTWLTAVGKESNVVSAP